MHGCGAFEHGVAPGLLREKLNKYFYFNYIDCFNFGQTGLVLCIVISPAAVSRKKG
jgi:hypothetical protein